MPVPSKLIAWYGAAALSAATLGLCLGSRVGFVPRTPGIAFVGLRTNASDVVAEFTITSGTGWRACLSAHPIAVSGRTSYVGKPSPRDGYAVELPRGCTTNVFVLVPPHIGGWHLQALFMHEPGQIEKSLHEVPWLDRSVRKLMGARMPQWEEIRARSAGVPHADP